MSDDVVKTQIERLKEIIHEEKSKPAMAVYFADNFFGTAIDVINKNRPEDAEKISQIKEVYMQFIVNARDLINENDPVNAKANLDGISGINDSDIKHGYRELYVPMIKSFLKVATDSDRGTQKSKTGLLDTACECLGKLYSYQSENNENTFETAKLFPQLASAYFLEAGQINRAHDAINFLEENARKNSKDHKLAKQWAKLFKSREGTEDRETMLTWYSSMKDEIAKIKNVPILENKALGRKQRFSDHNYTP